MRSDLVRSLCGVIYLFCFLFLFSGEKSSADVLGSFEQTQLLPGYIDLSLTSQVGKSLIKKGPEKFWARLKTPFKPEAEKESETKKGTALPSSENAKSVFEPDDVDRRTPSEILASFLHPLAPKFSSDKANLFIEKVRTYQQNAFLTFCSEKLPKKVSKTHLFCKEINWSMPKEELEQKEKGLIKLVKKWKNSASFLTTQLAIQKMEKAKELSAKIDFASANSPHSPNSQGAVDFLEAFFTAIEAYAAVQDSDPYWGTSTSPTVYHFRLAKSFIGQWKLTQGRVESANLLVPAELSKRFPNQVFFSPEQVSLLEKEGFDTSSLDPPNSGLWRKPTASLQDWNAKTYNGMGLASLRSKLSEQEAADMVDPDKVIDVEVLEIEKVRGTTPKLPVQFGGDQRWKMKFLTNKLAANSNMNPATQMMRLILAGEVNTLSAVNNLATMVGFTVDPTYFKRKVHVYLPEGSYEEDKFAEALEEKVLTPLKQNSNESWNFRSAFNEIGIDAKGRHYVEMRGVSFAKKPDVGTDRNIGSFIRHGLGKEFKREFRALSLLALLFEDLDVKDGNTKIKLVPGSAGPSAEKDRDFKLAFSAADMGGTMGFGFPNLYFPNLVGKVSRNKEGQLEKITLRHHSFFPMPIFDTVTFADAKWLLKLVNQIPADKVEESFLAGGFPAPVATYYKDLFLRRFEQLADALGLMGQIYVGSDQKLYEFEKRSKMTDTATYAVPGYEKFFLNGQISDPNNLLYDPLKEAYPRDWGTGLSKKIRGHHKDEFGKLLKKGMPLHIGNILQKVVAGSFQFSTTSFGSDGMVFPFCKNRCFFSGYKAGIDWFLPMRFVIENPTESAKDHPYWVIDMFRLAIVLGYGSGDIAQKLGASIQEQVLGLGGEFAAGMDFIKVRPVKDYATAMGHLKNNDEATRRYFFRNINDQILSQMQEGDIFIGSTYVGARASILAEPGGLNHGFVQPGIELGSEAYITNRIYTMKGANNHFMVNWANLKAINIFADLYIRLLFPRFPVLEAEYKKSSQNNRVYEFDYNDPLAKQNLLDNINRSNPDRVDPKFRYQTKFVTVGTGRVVFNLFEIRKWGAALRKGRIKGEDFRTGEKFHELAYDKEVSTSIFRAWHVFNRDRNHVRAQIDEEGNLFTKLDYRFYLNQAYRKDFLSFVKTSSSMLPPDFVVFDPKQVKYYLGDFEVNASVVLDHEAMDALFGPKGPSDETFCRFYTEHSTEGSTQVKDGEWCVRVLEGTKLSSNERSLHKFFRKFAKARAVYQALSARLSAGQRSLSFDHLVEREKVYKLLSSVVSVFSIRDLPQDMIHVIQKWVPKKNVFRSATMTSFLEGFPGSSGRVEISSKYQGKMKLLKRYEALRFEESFKIFSDEVERALRAQGLLDRSSVQF